MDRTIRVLVMGATGQVIVRSLLDGYWRAVGLHRAETEITPTPEAIINHLELL
jgi:hypothetical protein